MKIGGIALLIVCGCTALVLGDIPVVYWADDSLKRAFINGRDPEKLVVGEMSIHDVAIDPAAGQVYWTGMRFSATGPNGYIRRNDMGFTRMPVEVVLTQNILPEKLILDTEGGHMYFTGHPHFAFNDNNGIYRTALNGTGLVRLVATPREWYPAGLALDRVHGRLFWTAQTNPAAIWFANLDGSNPAIWKSASGNNRPGVLVLDAVHQRLYWSQFNMNTQTGAILRAGLDGLNETVVLTGLRQVQALTLDGSGNRLLYAQRNPNLIGSVGLGGENPTPLITGLNAPYGLALASRPMPPSWLDGIRDFRIDLNDLAALAAQWLNHNCGGANRFCGGMDVTADFQVDAEDLTRLAANWQTPLPHPDFLAGQTAWWPFDNDAEDGSGLGHHGSLVNFAAEPSPWTTGRAGQALRFDGVNDAVEHDATLSRRQFTICHWLKPAQLRNMVAYFETSNPAAGPYYPDHSDGVNGISFSSGLWNDPSHDCYFCWSFKSQPNGGSISGVGPVQVDRWTHVAVTWDVNNGKQTFYLNGELAGTFAKPSFSDTPTVASRIGATANLDPTFAWSGEIDDVRLFDRILSPEEIRLIMNRQ